MSEGLCRRRSLPRVAHEKLFDEILSDQRDIGPVTVWKFHLTDFVLSQYLMLTSAVEQGIAAQHLVNNGADAVDVNLGVVTKFREQFGGCVAG